MGWNLRCHSVRSHCVFEVVIQSTILYYKALLCTTQYYSSTTLYYKVVLEYYSSTSLYYKVLLHYYPVLHSTTPVLLCTTKYYSTTTLYYTVLLQYYSVLHSTTTYYSSTTLYYKVLLQYYSVLHSTTTCYSSTTLYYKAAFMIDPWHIWTVIYMIHVRRIWNVIYNARSNRSHPPTAPNTAPATQNDCDDWSASHMKRHLQCAEQQESSSNCTKYCTCHAKWLWWLIRVTYETSFTMSGATGITIHLQQILPLPRKMNLKIDPRHIWNVIYNARSNNRHRTSSPNTAPATQNESHDWSASHMKRHLQCDEECTGSHQPHQILRLPRNLQVQDFSGNSVNCFRQ